MIKEQITEGANVSSEKNPLRRLYNCTWRTSVLILTFHRTNGVVVGEAEGEIYNMHIPYSVPFRGLGDMMMKMDRIYDLLDYPQAEWQVRQWNERERWEGTLLESDEGWNYNNDVAERFRQMDTGKNPSVYVETRFRRYGSWQGILQAGKKKASYRSALEFLHYMTEYVKDIQSRY